MANVKNLQIGDNSYVIRDANTYRSLSETQEETLLNTGNYNGDFVADGEIFTCDNGEIKEYELSYTDPTVIAFQKANLSPYNSFVGIFKVGNDIYGVPSTVGSNLYKSIDNGKTYTAITSGQSSLNNGINTRAIFENGNLYIVTIESSGNDRIVYIDICENFGTEQATWTRYNTGVSWYLYMGFDTRAISFCSTENYFFFMYNSNSSYIYRVSKSDLTTATEFNIDESYNRGIWSFENIIWGGYKVSFDEGDTWERIGNDQNGNLVSNFAKNGIIYGVRNGTLYSLDIANKTWISVGSMTLNGTGIAPTTFWCYGGQTSQIFCFSPNNNTTVLVSTLGLEWDVASTTFERGGNPAEGELITTLSDTSFVYMYLYPSSPDYIQGSLEATPIRNLKELSLSKTKTEELVSGISLPAIATAGDGISFTSPSEQAFTIEGSGVIITNKIATGFDYNTYIIATASDEIIQNKDFEIGIKVKCDDFSFGDFLGSNDVDEQMKIPYIKIDDGEVTGWFSNSGSYDQSYSTMMSTTGADITEGSWVWIKVTGTYIEPDEYKYGIYVSKTGEFDSSSPHVEATDTGAVLQLSKLCLGAAANWSEMYNFDGSIDLNETYVKINNEIVWTPYISAGNKTIINANLVGIAQAGTGITFDDGSSTIQSFTVVGSPIITDGIMSFISTSNYVISNTEFPTTGVCSVLAKFYVGSYSSHQTIISRQDVDKELYIKKETGTLCFYDTQVRDSGLAISSGNTYWAKYTIDQSTKECIIAGILDNGYTKDTLPDDSNWTKVTWTSSEDTFGGNLLSIGADLPDNTSFNSGMIDLNEFYYIQDDLIVWTPYTMTPSGKIAITLDIATNQANAPTSSDEGYVGKLWITSSGAVYICTGVNGSTYTWTQMNNSGGSSTLAGLSDVDITSPSNGQALLYNGTSQEWNNGSGSSYNESTGILTII